jgi:hypothetical protein
MLATGSPTLPPAIHLPSWAVLLERFYSRAGLPPPRLDPLKAEEVPPPYQALLVHSSDMTPTLEGFYQQPLGLTVLSRELQSDSYLREVLLRIEPGKKPVAYGVIRICLDHFPVAARQRILEEQRPLGNILQTEAIGHLSWPQAFFRAEPDAHMTALLRLEQRRDVYGRRNVLLDGSRRLLAEVIEILAPVDDQPEAP